MRNKERTNQARVAEHASPSWNNREYRRTGVHVAVWIDHQEARLFRVKPDSAESVTVTAPLKTEHHKHPRGEGEPRKHPLDGKRFFTTVCKALKGEEPILLLGPSSAKFEFLRHLQMHHSEIEARVACVATVDHPTDAQLVAYARKYFNLHAVHFVKVGRIDAAMESPDPFNEL